MSRRGLTLLEMMIVVFVLAVVATLALPSVGNFLSESRSDVTQQSLTRLRDVIAQTYWQDANGNLPRPNLSVSPSRSNDPQLRYLFINPLTEDTTVTYNPATRLGWRGPYLVENNASAYTVNTASNFTVQYGENGDPAVLDGWGNPIVVQNPGLTADGGQDVRLVSAGPNGIVNIDPTIPTASLLALPSMVGDDAYIYFEVR